jgi:hypothetical protein
MAADFVTVPIAMAMVLYPRLLLILTAGLRVRLRWPGKHHAQSQHGNATYGNAGSDHCSHRATLCHAVCGPTQWLAVGFTTSPVDSRSATPGQRWTPNRYQRMIPPPRFEYARRISGTWARLSLSRRALFLSQATQSG